MREIGNPIFGKVRVPEKFEELYGLLWDLRPVTDHFRARMWRGQSNIEWPIHSSAFRKLALDGKPPSESHLRRYEIGLLKHATHRGYRRHDGRDLSDLELLAKLQHHGAATRLVDATRNALIALWFAISSDEDKTGLLLGVHTSYVCGYEGEPEDRSYDEVMDHCKSMSGPVTWEPPTVTNRIAAQHSQFLYSTIQADLRGSLLLPDKPDTSLFIAIEPPIKEIAKEILIQTFDIHPLTLFPDLDGFCRAYTPHLPEHSECRW